MSDLVEHAVVQSEEDRLLALIQKEVLAIRPALSEEGFRPDDEIVGHGLDSVDMVELVARLETQEALSVSDEGLGYVLTFRDLAKLLADQR